MELSRIYLALCIPGALVPYAFFVPWISDHGLDPGALFGELFSTRIGGFFGADVLVSAVVLVIFVATEGRRRNVKGWGWAIVGTLTVGVSFGLPLFLYLRERALRAMATPAPA